MAATSGKALKALAERMDMQDLRFLAVAVTIQQPVRRQPGRDPRRSGQGDPLAVQAVPPREGDHRRGEMVRHVPVDLPAPRARRDQRLQPDYYDEVKETSLFIPAALVVGVFLVANVIFMRMMVNIKV
jgi:tight adherence protein B